MSEFRKPFLKITDQKINVKMCEKKPIAMWKKNNSDKLKFGSNKKTRPRMNDERIGKLE